MQNLILKTCILNGQFIVMNLLVGESYVENMKSEKGTPGG